MKSILIQKQRLLLQMKKQQRQSIHPHLMRLMIPYHLILLTAGLTFTSMHDVPTLTLYVLLYLSNYSMMTNISHTRSRIKDPSTF
jgi:hypothetical protein